MESHSEPSPARWLTKRSTIVLIGALGLMLIVFQINKLLSSSFRIEVFGVEILEVEHLDDAPVVEAAPAVDDVFHRGEPARLRRIPLVHERREGVARAADGENVYVVVKEMPQLIGGLSGIQERLRYPQAAKDAGTQGRVIVQFLVNKHGRVKAPQVVRGVSPELDAEALRVVRQTRFKPGRQQGQPVHVKMALPITFRLD